MTNLQFNFKCISKSNSKIHNRQGRYFLTAKYKEFEAHIKRDAEKQWKDKPIEGAVRVSMLAMFNTKVHSDATNLFKGVLDALTGICYHDDRQIKDASVLVIENPNSINCFNINIEEICRPADTVVKKQETD